MRVVVQTFGYELKVSHFFGKITTSLAWPLEELFELE